MKGTGKMNNNKVKEFSVISIVTGVLLSVIFGAANAYLGLRVGMTVSASPWNLIWIEPAGSIFS